LYASNEAAKRSVRVSDEIQQVADKTEAFDPVSHELTEQQMDLIAELAERCGEPPSRLRLRHGDISASNKMKG
jgi:hypothetical protein